VSYSTPQAFKNAVGKLAYFLEGAKSLMSVKSYDLKLEYDGNVIEDRFIFGMVSNANSVGGFKKITGNDVALDDGLFEVLLVRKIKNIMDFQRIINSLILSDFDNDNIFRFKASNIKVYSKDYIDWTLDGEFGGYHKEVEIINHKQAINFLVEESIITELKTDNEDTDTYDEKSISEFIELDKIKDIAKNLVDDIDDDNNENNNKKRKHKK